MLHKMGIDLDSILCPRCSSEVESMDHALYGCVELRRLWNAVAHWWNIDIRNVLKLSNLLEMSMDGVDGNSTPHLWEEVVWSFLYLIWSHRNRMVFERCNRKLEDQFLEFQRTSYEWIDQKMGNGRIEWATWISTPKEALRYRGRF